jgi:cardiolipin synthase
MNMVDPRFFKRGAGVGQWVDAMVRVRGPVVAGLLGVSLNDWFVETDAGIEDLRATSGLKAVPPAGGAAVQVLPSGPARGGDGCLQMLLAMLFAAHRRVVITTPYFVPDESLLRALRAAAVRGVDVVLIVPKKVDSLLVRHASRSYYDDLVAAGVRIHWYTGGLLHTKSVAVDERLAMFGTHNMDLRSLWLNFEVSLFVYDDGFGATLAELHEQYLRQCEPLDAAAWRTRPWSGRLWDNLLRLFSPLL